MTRLIRCLALALSVVFIGSVAVYGATKPAAKKPSTTNKATMGTTQLKGDQAQIGTTYTLGKANPVNFTLKSVEYRVDHVKIGDDLYIPKGDEKLMVLHYSLHNPQKRDYDSSWHSLKFTAVDANDTNWTYCNNVGVEGKNERMNMKVKPAQKVHGYTIITVPAKGEIPKLIVESRDKLVLRYDLRGKVKGLQEPFADPEDTTGASALAQVKAKMGDYYPFGNYLLKVDKTELVDASFGRYKAKKGMRFLTVTYTAKNMRTRNESIVWHTVKSQLKDQDGVDCDCYSEVVRATREESVSNAPVEPGQEFTFRQLFNVPADIPLKSLAVRNGNDARTYVFDMSEVK